MGKEFDDVYFAVFSSYAFGGIPAQYNPDNLIKIFNAMQRRGGKAQIAAPSKIHRILQDSEMTATVESLKRRRVDSPEYLQLEKGAEPVAGDDDEDMEAKSDDETSLVSDEGSVVAGISLEDMTPRTDMHDPTSASSQLQSQDFVDATVDVHMTSEGEKVRYRQMLTPGGLISIPVEQLTTAVPVSTMASAKRPAVRETKASRLKLESLEGAKTPTSSKTKKTGHTPSPSTRPEFPSTGVKPRAYKEGFTWKSGERIVGGHVMLKDLTTHAPLCDCELNAMAREEAYKAQVAKEMAKKTKPSSGSTSQTSIDMDVDKDKQTSPKQ